MKIYLVNYGSGRFWIWQKIQSLSGIIFGIRHIRSWNRAKLEQTNASPLRGPV